MPVRVEPFQDLTVGSVLQPFREEEDGALIIKVCGTQKTKATYGSVVLSVVPELAVLLRRFISEMRQMSAFKTMQTRKFYGVRVFCNLSTGEKATQLSGWVPAVSVEVLGRRLTATHFRKGAVNLSREFGFSKALLHTKDTAFRHYLSASNPSMKGKILLHIKYGYIK